MQNELETLRHSAAHLLAIAVKNLYKNVQLGIGPSIEEGFYYDFKLKETFSTEDLKNIEKEMKKVAKQGVKFEKEEVTLAEAKKLFKNEPYKLELIKEIKGKINIYRTGNFIDLCAGPHLESTKKIRAFKLLKTSGSYWKGDSKNDQMQRIYGTAFETKEELTTYMTKLEEAKKRDHNKLGKELGLFVQSEVVGKGLPLLTPKGATIKRILRRWIEDEEMKRGYQLTETPVLTKTDLYKISGHIDHYKENMFILDVNGEEMALRPMTCPHQFMLYKAFQWSYKDLPVRYAEVASLFRN